MTWLSKLFGVNSNKITVSDSNDEKPTKSSKKSTRKLHKRSNGRGSVVMRQKMQKKIAESAKERVLDKRRSQKTTNSLELVFEKEFNKNDQIDELDFRSELIKNKKNSLVYKIDINLNRLNELEKGTDQHLVFESIDLSSTNRKVLSDSMNSNQKTSKESSQINCKFNQNGYEKKSKSSSDKEQNSLKEDHDQSELKTNESDEFTDAKISKKQQQTLNCSEQPELFSYRSLNSPINFIKETKVQEQTSNMSLATEQIRTLSDHQTSRSFKTMSEDSCAINELLEGRMDLQVIVPYYLIKNQKTNSPTILVLINVERNTPMLDLLIQIGNKIKFNVNDYKIIIEDELRTNYKANTPIGSLDVNQIQIVPKTTTAIALNREKLRELNLANQQNQQKSISTFNKLVQNSTYLNSQIPSNHSNSGLLNNGSIPFQTTFRLQVNLPYNQRMVFRVTPTTKIKEVKELVCEEKELNENKYQLVVFADLKQKQHPQILELDRTLAFYAVNEISLISNKNLEQMQMQNEISGLNNRLNTGPSSKTLVNDDNLDSNLNGNLNSIVNSQSTAASVVHRKAIISLLSATNQLEANCDYSNNICTKNKCVCNLSSTSSFKNCQKSNSKLTNSTSFLNKMIKPSRKKVPAPKPPCTQKENQNQSLNNQNLKRSISNNSMIINDKLILNNQEQIKLKAKSTKQRHNSGSDSSGYHECLSSANSPNNHHFGGSMINLSNNSLTISPISDQRLTSTPSSKHQYRSIQQLNNFHYPKKRRAPQPPLIEKSSEQDSKDEKNENEKIEIESNAKTEQTVVREDQANQKSLSIKSSSNQSLNNSKNEQNKKNLHLELKNDVTYSTNYSSKACLNTSNSFKSNASSGHSSGHSSSNSPELNEKDELISSSPNEDNSLENEIRNESDRIVRVVDSSSSGDLKMNNKELKLSNLVKENMESRFMNTKSPTSVASEPIYLTPKTYFNNQPQVSESTNSIVMLNLDEVRPSSAPNYCEDEQHADKTTKEHQLINQIKCQNENSKDSGIFLRDNVTVNSQLVKSNSSIKQDDENKFPNKDSKENNVTTLIINVNGEQAKDKVINKTIDDFKSVSTLIENGDFIIEETKENNISTANIAPSNCALKIEKDVSKNLISKNATNKDEIDKKNDKLEQQAKIEPITENILNSNICQTSKSRISNLKDQFEQQSSINKPKTKLKNFKIGSYSTNQTEEDIYSDSIRTTIYQTSNNAATKQQPYFRYLSSPISEPVMKRKEAESIESNKLQINVTKDQINSELERSNSENSNQSKPIAPIKKLNLNAIKFKEVALNEFLNENGFTKLNNGQLNEHQNELDNYNSDEFNDNQELTSLYLNNDRNLNENLNDNYSTFSYRTERLCNLSVITPQPYRNTRTEVPRKLFFGKNKNKFKIDGQLNGVQNEETDSSKELNKDLNKELNKELNKNLNKELNKELTKDLTKELNKEYSSIINESPNLNNTGLKNSINLSNSFKENYTRTYLVSDLKKDNQSNSVNNLNNSKFKDMNLSNCHDSLMGEIRAFGGKNSLKKVSKGNEEFEIQF